MCALTNRAATLTNQASRSKGEAVHRIRQTILWVNRLRIGPWEIGRVSLRLVFSFVTLLIALTLVAEIVTVV